MKNCTAMSLLTVYRSCIRYYPHHEEHVIRFNDSFKCVIIQMSQNDVYGYILFGYNRFTKPISGPKIYSLVFVAVS